MQQDTTIPQPEQPLEPPTPQVGGTSNKDGWKSILSTLLILAAAPLIAWLMITFIFQSYEVDGPSMETTLQNQDRLIVLKTGPTWAKLTGKNYVPQRDEIIVFVKRGMYEFGANQEKQLIKRVVGLPGDRVVVKDGKMTVYNSQNPEGFNPDATASHGQNTMYTGGNVDITVGEGEVFVAGDNRGNSLDSRTFGTIASDDIVGTLALRIFPINKAQAF